jgi:hypothetical protein
MFKPQHFGPYNHFAGRQTPNMAFAFMRTCLNRAPDTVIDSAVPMAWNNLSWLDRRALTMCLSRQRKICLAFRTPRAAASRHCVRYLR